ncbi:MAG: YlbF family regulator [Verrucomicrobiota bacterium]
MPTLTEEPLVFAKATELCEALLADPELKALRENIERFENDQAARLMYESVKELGEDLRHRQQSGVQLTDQEVAQFEAARDTLLNNEIASAFLESQEALHQLQKKISRQVGMTLEMGRLPTEEELAEPEGGCCGGGGGGGCGCN